MRWIATTCARQISEADGRIVRRRDIQAHLRACPELPRLRRRDRSAVAAIWLRCRRCRPSRPARFCRASSGADMPARGRRRRLVGAGAGKAMADIRSRQVGGHRCCRGGDRHYDGRPHGGHPRGAAGRQRRVIQRGAPRCCRAPEPRPATRVDPVSPVHLENPRRRPAVEADSPRAEADKQPAAEEAQGNAEGTNAAMGEETSPATPANGAAKGELPAASNHGQETAASHGGGRAAAEAKSKGNSAAARTRTVPPPRSRAGLPPNRTHVQSPKAIRLTTCLLNRCSRRNSPPNPVRPKARPATDRRRHDEAATENHAPRRRLGADRGARPRPCDAGRGSPARQRQVGRPPGRARIRTPEDVTPGPKAGLPEKAKAYGRRCQDQSNKHVKGEKGTPFCHCVTAMAKAANNESLTRQACMQDHEQKARERREGHRVQPVRESRQRAAQAATPEEKEAATV